jgi:hypothetical protein
MGVILYEICAFHLPFKSIFQITKKPNDLPEEFPQEFNELINKYDFQLRLII